MSARLASYDLGNGFSKGLTSAVWPEGVYFPSVYAIEEPGVDFEGLAGHDDFVIEYEGRRFAVGWSASRLGNISVRTLDRSRVDGPEYLVLFAAALIRSWGKGGEIAPVLSLPVEWYEQREAVKDRLSGEWSVQQIRPSGPDGNPRWHHFDVPKSAIRVIPEGFGSVCYLALDRNGRPRDNGLLTMTVGVVDVGTKTTDLSLFDRLRLVPARTRGFDVGLERVYDIMQRQASKALGRTFAIEELDAFINSSESLFIGPDDISDQADHWKHQALEQVSDAIAGHIATLWQGGKAVRRLLLTGGGARHVMPYLLRRFDHIEPVENGPMANCIGGYSYGLMREGG